MSTDPKPHPPGRIEARREGGVLRLRVCNPARYNAMSLSMWRALAEHVARADADDGVRVVVLEGEGERAFVSGADISEFGASRNDPQQVAAYEEAVSAAQGGLMACRHPVVAAIRGVCMGGGIGLALACDLRYCNASARLRMPAARLGLGYALAGMRRMVETLGAARVADLFMTARTFDGAEAARLGLAHEAYADADFDARVEERIQAVAGNAPLTLRAAKLALRHLGGAAGAPEAASVQQAVAACFASRDYREGQQAFQEKRPAQFQGR